MNLKKLLIATGNKGKAQEIRDYFKTENIECIDLSKFNIEEPEENGLSYEENAKIKSDYYCQKTGIAALADDSGLSINELDGKPGIYSARWAGPNKDFSVAMQKVKEELAAKNIINATGFFYCSLSLTLPNGENHVFSGKIDGKITFPPKGDLGFGYDPIFIPENHDKTFSEMPYQQKKELSHRTIAFKKFAKFIKTKD